MEQQKTKSQLAAIRRWAKLSQKQRSAHARKMVQARFAKMTTVERSAFARNLVQKRWGKELSTS
jgi:hypothetical protein